jgi:hypothetical protein
VSRAAKPAARKSPRRKAGSVARKEPAKQHFTLSVEGQEMRVTYVPNWSTGEFAHGHFEFESPYDPPRRIPVSETGYLSHFAPMADISTAESPADYARSLVEAALCLGVKKVAKDERQMSLF